MCGVGVEFDLIEDKQYKLEDFGEIVAWTKEGKPFIAYRDNKNTDTPQEQLSFEDTVRQLTKQYPNNMELGKEIRKLCDEQKRT